MADPEARLITAADLMLQLAAAKAEPFEGVLRPAVLGPKRQVIVEIGYLPFGRDEANCFS